MKNAIGKILVIFKSLDIQVISLLSGLALLSLVETCSLKIQYVLNDELVCCSVCQTAVIEMLAKRVLPAPVRPLRLCAFLC